MTTWKVPEMHCGKCVTRIQNALGALGVEFSVSLDDKTVSAEGDKAAIVAALDDLGFSAEEIG